MATATDFAELAITIDAGGAKRELEQLNAKVEQFGTQTTNAVNRVKSVFGSLGVGLGLGVLGKKLLDETIEAQNAMAQLEVVVKSTGGAAGYTAAQMADLASQLQSVTTYSDEAIDRSESVVATFTNIRGDNFKRAIVDIADMAERPGRAGSSIHPSWQGA
jgi:ferritin-like metal-binding protein YciE